VEGDNDSNPVTPRASESSPRAIRIGDTGNQSPGMLTYDAEQDAVVSSGNSTPVSSPRFFNRYSVYIQILHSHVSFCSDLTK
jgi:E3 ubiquitin-protein ligase RHF